MTHLSLGDEENLSDPLIDSQHIGHQWTDSWNTARVTEAVKMINKKKKTHM